MRISAKLNKKRKKKRKMKQRKKESKAQKTENLKPVEREMAKQERRSFGVTRGRKGFGCRRSTPKRRTDQIRELRERERCQSKSCSLSLSLSFIFKFCRVWEIPACHDCVCYVPRFFSKKKKKRKKERKKENTPRVQILGVSYQYPCRIRVGHRYLAKISAFVQHSLDVYDTGKLV